MLALVAIAAMFAATLYAVSGEQDADAAGLTTVWSDEFSGSGPVDNSKWTLETGNNNGWGNNELQFYQTSTNNVRRNNGLLEIIAGKRQEASGARCGGVTPCYTYTSGRLMTKGKFSHRYGRFEAKIKIPKGAGLWPAFWMMGEGDAGWPNDGAISIMEHVGREPKNIYHVVHGPGYSAGDGIKKISTFPYAVGAGGFHTYAVAWKPNEIVWQIDGAEVFRLTPANLGGKHWVFDRPFFMVLNMAVGGEFGGEVDANLAFPQVMQVDYVRVSTSTKQSEPVRAPVANPGPDLRRRANQPPSGDDTHSSTVAAEMVRLVNIERQKAGCSGLRSESRLKTAAQRHSKLQADQKSMSHQLPGEASMGDRVTAEGYRWRGLGENVVAGDTSAASAMSGWMNSPGHRGNILNCAFQEIGVGLATSSSGTPYWTQVFATPA